MSENPLKPLDALSAPLGELIAAVGRGVADAQQALDSAALAALQRIYADADDATLEALRQIDYRPTFYAIPEVESEMSVAVTIASQTEASGRTGATSRIYTAPVDATYKTRYGYDVTAASKIRFKIVPVPPSARVERLRAVPTLVGKTWEEAQTVLGRLDLAAASADPGVNPAPGAAVSAQDPAPGALVEAGASVTLTVAADK